MLKRDRDGQKVNALGRGLYSTHKYSSISFGIEFLLPLWSLVWVGGMSPRSDPLFGLAIDLNTRPIRRHMIDDNLSQSGSTGRGGQYGDRWRGMCTVFNNVQACHTVTQGKWQEYQEAECNFPQQCQTLPADVVSCICTASPSDQLHAGQMNGLYPSLQRLKNNGKGTSLVFLVCTAV